MISIEQIQEALNKFGENLDVDGKLGPMTEAAIVRFKKKHGLVATPYVGPITLEKLGLSTDAVEGIPWLQEMSKHMGMHEVTNNAAIKKWLKSDGQTLGDPARLPWCADAMETSIKLTLPKEPFKGNLARNPYWARNWVEFGKESSPKLGAIGVFSRPTGGHVAFLVGYDPKFKNFRVRGGNQSNTVSDTWIKEDRLVDNGIRIPSTWAKELPPLPKMNSQGQIISTNEA